MAIVCALVPSPRAQVVEATPAAPSAGILPVPDHSGELATRAFLSGDWGGTRQEWANGGLSFDVNGTAIHQAVRSGGLDEDAAANVSLEFLVQADLMRMGILPGALITLRTQSRFGDSVNQDTGMPLPVDTVGAIPITIPPDDDVALAITDLFYTQFLTAELGVVLGKAQMLDGDPNEFTGGRGRLQFMNTQFLFNPVQTLAVPYSAPAIGAFWMPSPRLTVSSYLMNTADASTTSGLDDVGEGTTWNAELNGQYRLGDLPGGMNLGLIHAFDNQFTRLDGSSSDPTKSTSWSVYWSSWQYLVAEGPRPAALNLLDGRADLEGLGVFSRFGVADPETSAFEWAGCIGLGGRGLLEARSEDSYGVGYFYNALQREAFGPASVADASTEGVEAYYSFALARSAHLSLDFQWDRSPFRQIDESMLLGLRLSIRF